VHERHELGEKRFLVFRDSRARLDESVQDGLGRAFEACEVSFEGIVVLAVLLANSVKELFYPSVHGPLGAWVTAVLVVYPKIPVVVDEVFL
jgi:hypothetical protein